MPPAASTPPAAGWCYTDGMHEKPRKRFQFGLLALFGLMTAVAAALAPRSILSEVVLRLGVFMVLGSAALGLASKNR